MIKKFLFGLLFVQLAFAQNNPAIWKEYQKGIEKSGKFSQLEQKKPLFIIDSSNQNLVVACKREWGCEGDAKNWGAKGKFKKNIRVNVVSVISSTNKAFDPFLGNQKIYSSDIGNLWVTATPELYNFCSKIKNKKNLKLEIEKYLGLPPNGRKTRVVSIWADPINLIRPCLSPLIYTTSCPLENPPGVNQSYLDMVNKYYIESHDSKGVPVPFTKKGYTYKWGDPNTYEGASEYMIQKGAKLYIEKINSFEEYCR